MPVLDRQKTEIGYFVSTGVDDYIFIGGAMVTDNHGLPIEFRYTEPVKANRLQRVLYGDVLERFIHTDVILANLIERLERKPTLLIVSDAPFIPAVHDLGPTGIWLGETRLQRMAAIGDTQVLSSDEFLLQLTESGSPTRVKTAAGDPTKPSNSEIAEMLVGLATTMDVLEPLRRIESAIRLIWEESPENSLQPMLDPR